MCEAFTFYTFILLLHTCTCTIHTHVHVYKYKLYQRHHMTSHDQQRTLSSNVFLSLSVFFSCSLVLASSCVFWKERVITHVPWTHGACTNCNCIFKTKESTVPEMMRVKRREYLLFHDFIKSLVLLTLQFSFVIIPLQDMLYMCVCNCTSCTCINQQDPPTCTCTWVIPKQVGIRWSNLDASSHICAHTCTCTVPSTHKFTLARECMRVERECN